MELVGGGRAARSTPTAEHVDALLGLGEILRHHFHRRSAAGAVTGGWWILGAVDIELAGGERVRPDLVGWRREQLPERPRGSPIRARPDWTCDILSGYDAPNAESGLDGAGRLAVLQWNEVPHYWIVDPEHGTLTAHRWTERGYVPTLHADRWQFVRVEPFDAIEIRVGTIFGDDPE
jgi:Uma2 family endonuclease